VADNIVKFFWLEIQYSLEIKQDVYPIDLKTGCFVSACFQISKKRQQTNPGGRLRVFAGVVLTCLKLFFYG
jgi:hypothetical protein